MFFGIIIRPIVLIWVKFIKRIKYVNKKVLKGYKHRVRATQELRLIQTVLRFQALRRSIHAAYSLRPFLLRRAFSLNPNLPRTVRIGATDSIFSNVIADKLAIYNEKFPAVKLELISSTSPYTIGQLKEGKCDVAFIFQAV